jgi:hypothetical protein
MVHIVLSNLGGRQIDPATGPIGLVFVNKAVDNTQFDRAVARIGVRPDSPAPSPGPVVPDDAVDDIQVNRRIGKGPELNAAEKTMDG